MAWDLATAKVIAPNGSDDALQKVMDSIVSELEEVLGRGILCKRMVEVFYNVDTNRLRLFRYPVRRVFSPECRIVHHRVGWVEVATGGDRIAVDYIGGLDPIPLPLERAMWEMFNTLWSMVDATTGLPLPGSGATVVQGSGEISRISLTDFGAISYDVGASVVGGDSQSSAADAQRKWGWLAPWVSILERYRSESSPIETAFA